MIREMIRLPVQMEGNYYLILCPTAQTNMDLHVPLRCMNVRIVLIVHYDLSVPKRGKVTTGKYNITGNGKNKKHIRENSIRKKKQAKFKIRRASCRERERR